MSAQPNLVFTIGHSTHPIGEFLALLQEHGVTALADVRSAPFSRFNPQFNKDVLQRTLKAQGIVYVYLGRELGARTEDPSCYENGRVQFSRLAQTSSFKDGLARIETGAGKQRIALMCAEKEPLECHRTLLVARALAERGIEVAHILADGSLERHESSMARLLEIVGLPQEDLFRSRDQLIEEAMTRQEQRIAYVDENLAAEARRGTE
jgi:uncharacterized protein (DUF488 family)